MRLKKKKENTHTQIKTKEKRNKRCEIRLSKFLDWQREKVVPRRNSLELVMNWKNAKPVTSLGDGLQEEKAWDFIPSRR